MRGNMLKKLALLTAAVILGTGSAFSAELNINTELSNDSHGFYLAVKNTGRDPAPLAGIRVYFNGQMQEASLSDMLNPGDNRVYPVIFDKVTIEGSYNLLVGLQYRNDGGLCTAFAHSVVSVGTPRQMGLSGTFDCPPIGNAGKVSFRPSDPALLSALRLVVPAQLTEEPLDALQNAVGLKVRNTCPQLNNNSLMYALYDQTLNEGGKFYHIAGSASTPIHMGGGSAPVSIDAFWVGATVIAAIAFMGLLIAGIFFLLKGKKDRGLVLIYCSALFLMAFFVRFFLYDRPQAPFWDENYHVATAQQYVDHVFIIRDHPPLGKLLMALGEVIIHPNDSLDLSAFDTTEYIHDFPAGYSFLGMRFFPALLSMLSVLLFFFVLYGIGKNPHFSFLFTLFYLFENAMVLHNRGAMLDSTQIFFMLLAVWYFVKIIRQDKIPAWKYGILGLMMGLPIATKLNGAILLIFFVFLAAKDYGPWLVEWVKKVWSEKKWFSPSQLKDHLGGFSLKVAAAVLGTALSFCVVYYINFALATDVRQNLTYRASPEYLQIVRDRETANPLHFPLMLRDNFAYIQHYHQGVPKWDPTKEGENGSPAFTWPFGYKSINYRWSKSGGKVGYFYLVGNPVVWNVVLFSVLTAVILILARCLFGLKFERRKSENWVVWFLLTYLVYMGVMLRMDRVMYLYHYFVPLIFGIILSYTLFHTLFEDRLEKDRLLLAGGVALALAAVIAFFYFFPLTYGYPIDATDFARRIWSKVWDLKPVLWD